MLIDFHCHHQYEGGIICTDSPLSNPDTGLVRCIGLLPDKWTPEMDRTLISMLEDNPDLQLGEVGLDRRFQDRLPMERQKEILKGQLCAAIEMGRSVSLHCVQATGHMLEILSSLEYRPFSIVWHGFTGSKETASELQRLRVMISIGPRTKDPLQPLIQANGHFVLETDYEGPSDTEHSRILSDIYTRASRESGMEPEKLLQHCSEMLKLFCPPSV